MVLTIIQGLGKPANFHTPTQGPDPNLDLLSLVHHLSIADAHKTALDLKHLRGVGPLDIALQHAAGGQRALFKSPVPFLTRRCRLKVFLAGTESGRTYFLGKERSDVVLQLRLILFDPPDVFTPAFHNLHRQFALGQ